MAFRPEPFALAVPEEELEDLRRRLRATRWPDQLQGLETGWESAAFLLSVAGQAGKR